MAPPQLLPLQQGQELPFFADSRRRSHSRWAKRKRRLLKVLSRYQRILLVFLVACFILGFIYVQLFNFPRQLQSNSNSVKSRPVFASKEVKDGHVKALTWSKETKAELEPPEQMAQIAQPDLPIFSGPGNDRQKAVRDAFLHAWRGYKQYAWGHDLLRPVYKGYTEWFECGLTIVDSLDTLIIMGLKEEFKEAKEWVEKELDFDKNRFVNLFETTIRVLGGLLSAYHLSGERVFLTKAQDLGDRLLGALHSSPSKIPYSDVNLKTKGGKQPSWSGDSSLAEVGSIQLEFRDLSRLTHNNTYEELTFHINEHIHADGCNEHGGLCGMFISPADGRFRTGTTLTFGARADSYYEYLLKQWLQTGKTVGWLLEDYKRAMNSMRENLWRLSGPSGLSFVGEMIASAPNTFTPKMDHLVCFLSGTLALGAQNGLPQEHLEMAKNLSRTCREMYRNPTGLGPEIAHFNTHSDAKEDINIKPLDTHSLLRPEAIESWFYLYRITGDPQYQEWGWESFQAIEKYAKVENGYSSVNNVKQIPVTYRDNMDSFFLAETLKYLYLLLADDQTILPLHKYVFNTEAHPLPIYAS